MAEFSRTAAISLRFSLILLSRVMIREDLRRSGLRLADLYRREGACWYNGGWNWRAVVALGPGVLLAVGGAWSAPGPGPFPRGGPIPVLRPLCNYDWVVGFAVALVLYWGLMVSVGGSLRQRLVRRAAGLTRWHDNRLTGCAPRRGRGSRTIPTRRTAPSSARSCGPATTASSRRGSPGR